MVRDLINSLTIRCPHGTECNWTGRVDALDRHGSTCIYKTIECDVEGCNHTCQRKDMADHLSDTDVKLRHMELKCDKKLTGELSISFQVAFIIRHKSMRLDYKSMRPDYKSMRPDCKQ